MTLRKEIKVDQLEVKLDGHIQIRERILIKDGDNIVTNTIHRRIISPGQDVTNEEAAVRGVVEALWTPEILEAYEAKMAKAIKEEPGE